MVLENLPLQGARLKKESLWFRVDNRNIAEMGDMNLDKLAACFEDIEQRLSDKQKTIAKDILKEIRERLQFPAGCGTYLSYIEPAHPNPQWR